MYFIVICRHFNNDNFWFPVTVCVRVSVRARARVDILIMTICSPVYAFVCVRTCVNACDLGFEMNIVSSCISIMFRQTCYRMLCFMVYNPLLIVNFRKSS